ncbi:hypothetical protein CLV62_13638 [Dysgonomonas alginatilytica]|uniref:Uncharacterized protein n=1 Tax=Dysgonomonas alginatilytica TaxID=1605892 RepID=A0A2V3PII6_9BACT|nr:hypothetical protein CLV62_13638 [Dysgonomonas alginatilytica]
MIGLKLRMYFSLVIGLIFIVCSIVLLFLKEFEYSIKNFIGSIACISYYLYLKNIKEK